MIKFNLFVFFMLFVTNSFASVVENNETNVGVFVNHLSSCNLNHETGNMLCINQDFNTVIQYHDVKQVAMCPYHYCVLFEGNKEYSCTGYIWTLVGGKMNTHLNPLTPNTSYVGFTGNPSDEHIYVGRTFLGYNIIINYFEQNVDNHSPKAIDSITCFEPYSTKVMYQDGTNDIFGAHDIKFRGMFESLLLGVIIHTTMSFAMYIFAFSFCKCGRSSTAINLCLIPLVTFLSCYMILFVAERFVVKILEFIISSIFGIVFGYILASIAFNSITYCIRNNKTQNRVDAEEATQFVITSDEDPEDRDIKHDSQDTEGVQMTEIDLNNDEIRRI